MVPLGKLSLILAGIGTRLMWEGEPILNQNVYSLVMPNALTISWSFADFKK
jgi:hypothetical protein